MRRCAISVDLDEIHHYHAIHGLPSPQGAAAHAVYDIAVDRCLEWARGLSIPLTFFVVASDLQRPENVALIRRALAEGHEIGNHSRDHLYDLVLRSPAEQREQVEGAQQLFETHLGLRAKGFRAPGYTVDDPLLEIVREAGHSYDSSVFPCPAYYLAKQAALLALRLRGRRSGAIAGNPAVLTAPTQPYRVGRPYTQVSKTELGLGPGPELWEFPIQVTRGPRLPFIGTGLILGGRLGARALTELVVGEPFVNLELHGIDFLSVEDGLEGLRGYQPDARVPHHSKRTILASVVGRLRAVGYRFVRLVDGWPGA